MILALSLSLPFTTRTGLHGRCRSERRLTRTSLHVILLAPVRALGALWSRLFSFTVFANGCRRPLVTELGARLVASRSCVVPTWHAVPASGWCRRRQPAPCTPPSSSVTPRCFKFTVLKAFARGLAHALLARAPPSLSGLVVTAVHGGAGLQFLNWSCPRQPSHRLAASPLSLHPKSGPRSISTLLFTNGNGPRGRCRSVSASPDVTPRHARRAREGPWRFVASSVQLCSLCQWMPKAPRDGARCADGRFAELCGADVASCISQRLALPKLREGSPHTVHRLARL